MKLGEVVVTHVCYNFTKFHQNWMKNKKVLLIAHFSVQNFKLSVELWNSYKCLAGTICPFYTKKFLYFFICRVLWTCSKSCCNQEWTNWIFEETKIRGWKFTSNQNMFKIPNWQIFKTIRYIMQYAFIFFNMYDQKVGSGPENLKKSRQKNSWNQIFFSWNCIFGNYWFFGHFWNCKKWNLVK